MMPMKMLTTNAQPTTRAKLAHMIGATMYLKSASSFTDKEFTSWR